MKHIRATAEEIGPRLTKTERLAEIRRRHDRMRREIETIKEHFELEGEEE